MSEAVNLMKEFIKKHHLFLNCDKILLAVSGGKDSVLMAHLFKHANFNFGIAHCNFNLRGDESTRDQLFVENLAAELDVPIFLTQFNTIKAAEESKKSIQMAARNLRYNYFEQIKKEHNFKKIAVAHHQNDAVETILINLIRGTGIRGLHGILPQRDDIIRPLLCFSSEQIEQLINEMNLSFVEDSSNASEKYMRNRIRLAVIPQMKIINPSLEKTFEKNIDYFLELEQLLNNEVKRLEKSFFTVNSQNIKIEIKDIKKLQPINLLFYELLRPYNFNETTLSDVLKNLDAQTGKNFFSDTHRLIIDRGVLIITKHPENIATDVEILENDEFSYFNFCKIVIKKLPTPPKNFKTYVNKIFVDSDKLIYPLKLRNWQKGDLFEPFGMKGVKKLSDYFISKKVPLHQKNEIPILVNGNNEIIWICGFRSDNRYKIDANTKKIITFELEKLL